MGPHFVIFCLEPDGLINQFSIEEISQIPETEEYLEIYQEIMNSIETCPYQYQNKSTEDSILTVANETPSFHFQIIEETPLMSTEYLDSGLKASKSKDTGPNSQPLKDLVCRPKRTRGGSRRSIPYLPPGNDTSSTREFSSSYDQGVKNLPNDVSYEENGWSDLSAENQSTADGNARACKKWREKK